MSAQVVIAILVGVAAVVDDLARRQIANWIPIFALAGGLGWQVGQRGWPGLLVALEGTAAGFAAFLIFYLLGGMGGGDIKLMAGFGALLGAARLAEAALWTAGVGGVLALGFLAARTMRRWLGKTSQPKPAPAEASSDPGLRPIPDSIPYAPAIALGVWLALVPKG
jgi:prepilin peptidase CpaA